MPRELKRGEVTAKDMSVLREGDIAKIQQEAKKGTLRDYSLNHKITLYWDLNDEAIRDTMCRLVVDDYEMIIDAEELMRYLRWV